jgi:hypothetical protein
MWQPLRISSKEAASYTGWYPVGVQLMLGIIRISINHFNFYAYLKGGIPEAPQVVHYCY